ncbi:hypothetical protein LSH36_445g01006 [Paralvinella palmiformis]|uniref:Malonyl-CoA decarboxylase n=1 Tax=Paralvinella palmiformis TaxID=53620 RepID=A0AAD9JAQ3_9ANNE|nr:hypothetical protein LSH36_445g01006 [Paralvinella palmiformis]
MSDHTCASFDIKKVPFVSGGQRSFPASPSTVAHIHTVKEKLNELLTAQDGSFITNDTDCMKEIMMMASMSYLAIHLPLIYGSQFPANGWVDQGTGKTRNLCQCYNMMIPDDKAVFLKMLASDYNIQQDVVLQLANQLATAQTRGQPVLLRAEDRLRQALVPKYQQLFTQISRLENGVKFLVDLRTDLLNILANGSSEISNSHLQSMNMCLHDLLHLWFSVGFLHLERITWQSPGDMLQKISEYEAVHPIRNYTDLMRRVGSYRRCFIFMHNSMPREPVVVLHTALTTEISNSIQDIVTRNRLGEENNGGVTTDLKEDPERIKCAIFYSITSTQRGLQGVELGNYLIRSVVRELLAEFPKMNQFSSLSPIPGFKDWLMKEIVVYMRLKGSGEHPEQTLFLPDELRTLEKVFVCQSHNLFDSLLKALKNNGWFGEPPIVEALRAPLMRICARYLYVEKRRGYALNLVANFHLRNGAVMWRLNWLADTSPRGLGASCGLMVNYRYYLDKTEEYSKNYIEKHEIVASEEIHKLVTESPNNS